MGNTVIIYESTGLNFNLLVLLEALGFKETDPEYIANGDVFYALFTFFRMILGTWSTWTFVTNWTENRPSRSFKMASIVFHLLSVYWYLHMSEIIATKFEIPFLPVNDYADQCHAVVEKLPVQDMFNRLLNTVLSK